MLTAAVIQLIMLVDQNAVIFINSLIELEDDFCKQFLLLFIYLGCHDKWNLLSCIYLNDLDPQTK